MIPDNRFSSTTFKGQLYNPWDRRKFVSLHWGPVAIQDPSQGLGVQLWKAEAVGAVLVISAPNTPPFDWYTHSAKVDEVSLAFDQNGRPVVAFVDADGSAFLRWFDPVPNAIVNFNVTSFATTPRVTLDDNRPFNGANSDVILGYVRAGIVRFRQQRDRFTVEYTPLVGPGGDPATATALRHISMNSRLRLEFLTNEAGDELWTLAEVVQDLSALAGVPAGATDVRELYDDIVQGLGIASDEGLDKPIQQLMDVFFFGKSEHDRKIYFPKRGREPVARIPYADLVAGNPKAIKQKRVDETKLAREVNVNHIDPDGGFAKNKQFAQRRSNLINAEAKRNIETQVVLTVDQAATVAETTLRADWNELVGYEFATTIKWTELTPGDVVEVEDELGTWHRMRLETRNEDGVIDWEGVQDAGARTYGRTYGGNSLPPPVSTTPGLTGETMLEIVNVSPLLDQNDEVGLYVAAAGVPGSSWTGFQLLVSVDGGLAYTEAMRADAPSTIGETTTDLPAEAGHDIVSSETVEVTTNFPLASITSAQLAAGQNRIVFGDELGQFETATLLGMVGTLYNYELSGLRRAKYGTPALALPAGTRIVLIDETVAFVQAQRAMIGVDLHYKPVSYGLTEDDTIATAYLFDEPNSQLEWVPDSVAGTRDIVTNDITVTFVGRPRLGQFGTPFHSKYFRGYRITFSDAHVIETMAETAVYAAAPPGVTFVVCGLNEITGAGPASATTVPV